MSDILAKIFLVVAMTHGLRLLGRTAGPRWGGLALGLPCTTAVALAGCGSDRGIDFSVAMADHCLIGLAGAVVVPLAFAGSIGRGWRLGSAAAAAASAYFGTAFMAGQLSPFLVGGCLGVALMAVMAGAGLASRVPTAGDERGEGRPSSAIRAVALRTLVPIACLLSVLAVRDVAGPIASGVLGTFPGVGLTLLILTYLESGPGAAMRMARALPSGNFGMVAFLASFRLTSPHAGLFWGMGIGYLAALTVLATVAAFGTRFTWPRFPIVPPPRTPGRPAWPRPARAFLPKFDPIVV